MNKISTTKRSQRFSIENLTCKPFGKQFKVHKGCMTGSVIPSLMFTLHIELEGSKKGQNIPSTPLFLTDSNTAKDKHGNTTNGMMSQICINTYGKILENQEDQQSF